MPIQLACETYTWQMPGEQYKGKLDHIMGVISQAGFKGIEPETSFFGDLEDPLKMKATLEKHGLELTALCHVEDWLNPEETAEEAANAEKWMRFLEHFPNTIYLLVQMPGADRNDLEERQQNLLSCVNAVSERAYNKGITCSYHPNSPMGSIFRTEEDYKILLGGLDDRYIGYTPDVGHIAKGGMDPLSIIKEYMNLVNLVHYKDMYADGRWAPTGDGIIDFKGITEYLVSEGYDGWIIMEDECDACITDPDGVTLQDGVFIKNKIEVLLT
ncbi:MAG: sugar phosphate isomerase/epimerase [Bacteroidota bacterium]